ncbi:MAG: NAD-dependent epimerase/dehydratase family protein [Solirubrobacteraceae bacterium]
MRALVTGGAGFIGSNLVDALAQRGDDVAVVDDLSTGSRSNLTEALAAGARLHVVDIRDAAALQAVMADQRPEAIFHLAAQIDVRHSVSDPGRDAEVNILGTINVLEAARQEGVRRVVYSATGGAIYGKADTYPTPEDDPVRPLAPYGQSKYAAEGYCGLYRRLHGISVVTLRYANVYGPRQDPLGEGGVIAIFCGRLATGEPPVVFGDGRQTRDYTYVGDVVSANLLAAESDAIGAYNIGTGIETSVLDLIKVMAPMSRNGTFSAKFVPARPGEVERSVLDASQARAALGWEPAVDLRDGLQRTLQSL